MENKFKAFALSALACATMGLASCSTIEAELPTEIQDEPILNLDGVVNNDLQKIYEALVTNGDTNSERVLNNILTLYAKTLFGDFYGEGGLYEASLDDAKLTAYVSAHAIFGEGETGKKNAKAFINHVIDSIKTQMWSVVQNTTYQKNSVFLEEKFYNAQLAELYKLGTVSDFKEVELDGELTYKDVELYFTDMFNTYKDYIERSLLPTIYRTALVERYIIDNNYGVLGRSYARKVQFIALPDVEDYDFATQRLVRSYAKLVWPTRMPSRSTATSTTSTSSTKATSMTPRNWPSPRPSTPMPASPR